jgi:hypothetical protein
LITNRFYGGCGQSPGELIKKVLMTSRVLQNIELEIPQAVRRRWEAWISLSPEKEPAGFTERREVLVETG